MAVLLHHMMMQLPGVHAARVTYISNGYFIQYAGRVRAYHRLGLPLVIGSSPVYWTAAAAASGSVSQALQWPVTVSAALAHARVSSATAVATTES